MIRTTLISLSTRLYLLITFTVLVGMLAGLSGLGKKTHAYPLSTQASHPLLITEIRKIIADDGEAQELFGSTVAIDGDLLVVGVPNATVDGIAEKGAAYLYQRNLGGSEAWGFVTKLTSEEDVRKYGHSVAVNGDVIVVGAPEGTAGGSFNRGAVYVYYRNLGGADQWGQAARLVASDGNEADRLGFRVAINGDTIAASAPFIDSPGMLNHGGVYVFERNQGGPDQWGQVKKILADDRAADDRFGRSLAIHGNIILVGSPDKTMGANPFQGAAYIFERNQGGVDQWGQVGQLVASNGSANDLFGWSVAIEGDLAAVGAPWAIGNGYQGPGHVYLYQRNAGGMDQWGEMGILSASDGRGSEQFGQSVAISGDVIIVGAHQAMVGNQATQGAAYLFERNYNGADAWGQYWKLTASDGTAWDRFGGAVSIHGQAIAVGAGGVDVDGNENQGAVYVYRASGSAWALEAKPLAIDGEANDQYGAALSLSGSFVVVGAPSGSVDGNIHQGSAYVHSRNADGSNRWGQAHQLVADDGSAGDRFGSAASIYGDVVLVGAPYANVADQSDQGAVYVFYRNQGGADQWGQVYKLTASDGAAGDLFGSAVSLYGNTVVIGAPGVEGGRGAAYIFDRNRGGADAWGEVRKIMASDGNAMDQFGVAVALYGGYAAIGAPYQDTPAVDQGAVYIFHRNQNGADQWGLVQKVTASDGQAGDRFGSAVALDREFLLAGAPAAQVGGNPEQGAAYLFERSLGGADTWGQLHKLVAHPDGAAEDAFGVSVAVNSEYAVVGSHRADLPGSADRGAVYVFERNKGEVDLWGLAFKLTAADGQSGDQFGRAAALSGTAIATGAPFANPEEQSDRGAVYIYRLMYEFIDLEITKTVSVPIAGPGQPVSYVLSFANQGDALATGIILSDPIPSELTDLSWTSSGVEVVELAPGYVWQIADLAPMEGGTITVTGLVRSDAASGVVVNTAEISSPQPELNTENNISSVSFIIDADPPALPVHLSPPNGSSHTVNVLNLQWLASTSPDVAGYRVDLQGVITDVGNATQFTTPVLPDGTYTWRVAAYDQFGNLSAFTQPWSFTILDTTPPSVPVLVSPENGSTLTVSAVTLMWNPSPEVDTAGYRLRLNGGSPLNLGNVTTYDLGPVANGMYSWQVAAYDFSGNESAYSPLWTFAVADITPPVMPTLVSPPDGSVFGSGAVTLAWNPSPSPDVAGYRLNLNGTIIPVGDITHFTTNPLENGLYTWRVSAYDGAGNNSAFTAPWSFTIADLEPPEPPSLVSPEDGATITDNHAILQWNPSPSPDVAGYRLDFNGEVIDLGTDTSFATGALDNGIYTWRVAAFDGAGNVSGFTATWVFTIVVDSENNQLPVADAGPDQIVRTGESVILDGSNSHDPGGHLPLTYVWNQIGGIPVNFDRSIVNPGFTAPYRETVLVFRLVVIDAQGMASLPDTTTVRVERQEKLYLPAIVR